MRRKRIKYVRNYYKSPLQGMVRFRSSYEEKFAKYLDKNHILWLYESIVFEIGCKENYIPDFYLPKENKVVEIKGYMRKSAKRKIDIFKELYNIKFVVLFKEDLIKLGVL